MERSGNPLKTIEGKYFSFEWDPKNAFDAEGNLKEGYFKSTILFYEKNENIPKGEIKDLHAIARVFTSGGKTIDYDATTLPSHTDRYGIVKEGLYIAKKGEHKGYPALNLYTTEGSRKIPAEGGYNPKTGKSYLIGINIHKSGVKDYLGIDSRGNSISEGCFIIKRGKNDENYNEFLSNFGDEKIGVILLRESFKGKASETTINKIDKKDNNK